MIVNVDGESPDGTAEAFQATPTAFPKVSIAVRDPPGGKGANLRRFFEFCETTGVDHLATIDGDLRSIEDDWVPSLLGPLISGSADFVAPLYRRNRFEAAITNHLAYPLVFAWLGSELRQPIGGEFGISRRLLRYVLSEPWSTEVFRYGVDIFLAIHAAGAGFRIDQACLGRKVHNPTYTRMVPMFSQVFSTALGLLGRYPAPGGRLAPAGLGGAIDESRDFDHRESARTLSIAMRARVIEFGPAYESWAGVDAGRLLASAGATTLRMTPEIWVDAFAGALVEARRDASPLRIAELTCQLEPLFFLRAVDFWEASGFRTVAEIEEELAFQATLLRETVTARGFFHRAARESA